MKHDYEIIAKIVFTLVNNIRELNNETEIESFDSISKERKQQLYDNIEIIRNNPSTTAKQQHDIWMNLKLNDGWMYNKTTDRNNKLHNCLVPFKYLNYFQKLKDEVAINAIKLYFNL